jgi:hypothetical protein
LDGEGRAKMGDAQRFKRFMTGPVSAGQWKSKIASRAIHCNHTQAAATDKHAADREKGGQKDC